MRNLLFLLFLFMSLSSTTCNDSDCKIKNDCFKERETIKTHEFQLGEIKEVTKGHFAIITEVGNHRFGPCNMETKYCVEGMKVEFCGIEKATLPNERRASTPFVLGHIKSLN